MCRVILFYLFINYVKFIVGGAVELNLAIKFTKTSIFCEQGMVNLETYKTTLLEGEPVKITIGYSKTINYIECSAYNDSTKIYLKNPTSAIKNPAIIQKATKEMAGIWNCTILVLQNLQVAAPKPIVKYKDNTYRAAYCFIEVAVRELVDTPTVIANYMVLPSSLSSADEYTAEYHYVDGDMVDYFCISPDINKCQIKINYTNFDSLMADFYKNSSMSSTTDTIRTGFRIRLQGKHDKKTINCTCMQKNDIKSSVIVTFNSAQNEITNDVCSIDINGLPGRFIQKNKENKVNYRRFKDVPFDVKFEKNDIFADDLHLSGTCFGVKHKFSTVERTLEDPEISTCDFVIQRGTETAISAEITTMPKHFKSSGLTMISENVNFVLKLYRVGALIEEYIYNNYNEGDTLSVKCFIDENGLGTNDEELIVTNNFNGTDKDLQGVISKEIPLSSNNDGNIFECSLKEKQGNTINKLIHMGVHINDKTTPTPTIPDTIDTTTNAYDQGTTEPPTGPGSGNSIWMIAIAILGACIVLVIIVAVFYKMKKRTQQLEPRNNYENFDNSATPIPPYPKQWTAEEQPYRNPADFQPKNDNIIYSEPFGNDPTYARPIPKNQRGRVLSPDPTYAELDLPRNGRSPPTQNQSEYATVGEMYAKVLPKGVRNNDGTYSNTFPNSPYVNSERPEYVEPAYCEPHKIKK